MSLITRQDLSLPYYRDKRVISVFVMGMAQGLPWVMIGSVLTLWLKESGVSRTNIGYAALIYSVYAVNFLWSPLVDVIHPKIIPGLGQRQSWVMLCLLIIAAICMGISQLNPHESAKVVVLMCLLIAAVSATQDIAIDAYRVDSFSKTEGPHISAAAAMATAGWWTAYAGLGFLPLWLSDRGWSWPQLYQLLAIISLVICACAYFLPNPRYAQRQMQNQLHNDYLHAAKASTSMQKARLCVSLCSPIIIIIWALLGSPGAPETITESSFYIPSLILFTLANLVFAGVSISGLRGQNDLDEEDNDAIRAKNGTAFEQGLAWVLTALVGPLKEFFSRNGFNYALALLAFILLFKLGEAFLGRMSIVFYKEVGFSNTEIATYSKLLTWWLTVFFALLGGAVNAKLGLVKGLFISGTAMALTNLMFAWIAYVGPDVNLYAAAIVLDGFASAWSTVALVSFISLMCHHAFSATQYALMASLSNLGKTSLSSMSGQLVDWLDGNWALFFALTTVMVIPSLLILLKLGKRITQLEVMSAQQSP